MEKIEILLATYNGQKYIKKQIESILNQEYKNWIIKIYDDSSKDGTYEILLDYQKEYPDKIQVIRNNPGFGSAKANFMNMLRNSTEKYVMCCDQDDVWLPNKITLSYEMMKKCEKNHAPNHGPILIHTDLKVVDSELNIMSDSFFEYSKLRKEFELKDNLIQNFVTGCTMMMNRELVYLLKELNECEDILMHDWALSLLATTFGCVGFVDKPTMLYRQHAVNSVGAKQYGMGLFIAKLKENKMREAVQLTSKQAAYILSKHGDKMTVEQRTMYLKYSKLFDVSKAKRVAMYFQNGFWKNGFARKVCQVIFC